MPSPDWAWKPSLLKTRFSDLDAIVSRQRAGLSIIVDVAWG
jgi:hypothetical protein